MSENNRYYHTIYDNKKLLQERNDLLKQYEEAIENDLPFEETKKIYLRLKEIGWLLKKSSHPHQLKHSEDLQ
jgi:hypothetical protein